MEENKFSNFIKELRIEKGLSQDELAKALYVHRTTVNKWEKENVIPLNDKLLTIADFFNVSVDELLNGKRNEIGEDSSDRNNTIIELIKSKTKSQKCFIYCSIICLLLVVGFLVYYFISNYNSVKVYITYGENENIKTSDGLLFFSKDKVYYKPGNFYDSKDELINVDFIRLYSYDKNNKESILLTGDIKKLYIQVEKSQELFNDILSNKKELFLDACYMNTCYKLLLIYINDFKNDDLINTDMDNESVFSLYNTENNDKDLIDILLDNDFSYDDSNRSYFKIEDDVEYYYFISSNMIVVKFDDDDYDTIKIMTDLGKILIINKDNPNKNIYILDYKNKKDKNYQVFKKYLINIFPHILGIF